MAFLIVVVSVSLFSYLLPLVQTYRLEHPWLLYLLPVVLLSIVWDQKQPRDVLSTREAVRALSHGVIEPTTWAAGIKQIFLTLTAHLFGASVGREAVGIQLGGWASSLRGSRGWYFSACLAAGFSIVLGTPIAAAIFIFESKKWELNWTDWVGIPLLSWIAFRISSAIGVTHLQFRSFEVTVTELLSIGFIKIVIIFGLSTLVATLLAIAFLYSVSRAARRNKNFVNQVILPLVFLSLVGSVFGFFGSRAEATGLPGLGLESMRNLWLAEPDFFTVYNHPLLFGVLKVFLTAAIVGIGIRGGELTPLLVAGSMVAVGIGGLMGVPIGGLISIGFPLIWGIAARRPIAAAALAIELFGFSPWGSIGVIVFGSVFVGIKLGDQITKVLTGFVSTWRCGLYD